MANYLEEDLFNQEFLNQNEIQNEVQSGIQNEILNENQVSEPQIYENSQIMTLSSDNTQLSSKTGYFYIQISGNGKTTKRLIRIELSSKDMRRQQTVKFSEVEVDGYSDNHNFQIITTTSKTKKTSNYYTILTMEFTYMKPAHYMSSGDYSNKVDGYRFNFKEYTEENEGSSTVNNTGHNISNTTETIKLQINVANCGINQSSNHYVAKNATGIINLNKTYYSLLQINPNGGTHNGKNSTYNYGAELCTTIVTMEKPTRPGYEFTGWTLTKGSYCTGASFNISTNIFTYCGKSTTTSNISANNTCVLKANWKIIYGTITIKSVNIQNNGLIGSKYSIYNSSGKQLQTLQTGNEGNVQFTQLPVGKYIIYEDKIQQGYELVKTNAIELEITEENTNIIYEINHSQKMVLPETGGISKDGWFILIGIIVIIIVNKKGGIYE